MRRKRLGPSPLAVLAAIVVLGCGRAPDRGAWRRIDLYGIPASTIAAPPSDPFWRARKMPTEAWPEAAPGDASPGSDDELAHFLRGGAYRALRVPVGAEVVWRLDLPAAAHLTYRPLRTETADGCRYLYRFSVVDKGPGETSGEGGPVALEPRPGEAAGALRSIDLDAFGGRAVALRLTVQVAPEGCAQTPSPGLLASAAVYGREPRAAHPGRPGDADPRPNILLVAFDAMRADDLGAWGRVPSLTPALDALAAESDVYRAAFSTFNATNPSFASIFTGKYGKNHGVYDLKTPLGDGHVTLAEILADAGWTTGAVVAARHLAGRASGLDQGFGTYDFPSTQAAAEAVVDQGMSFIQAQDRPFFLWLHIFDPHTPHRPPPPFDDGRRPVGTPGLAPVDGWAGARAADGPGDVVPSLGAARSQRDGELAYLDHQVDRLLDFLRSRDLLRNTLLVVLADHGENANEHGAPFDHAGLWDATTHVPFMIRWPGERRRGRVFDQLVQTIDLFPTVLRAAGLDPTAVRGAVASQDGRFLAGPNDARLPQPRRYVFAEHANHLGAMVRDRHHLFHRITRGPQLPGGRRLFDVRADPGQIEDRAPAEPGLAEAAERLLDQWLADRHREIDVRDPIALDDEERAQLRALGYLDP